MWALNRNGNGRMLRFVVGRVYSRGEVKELAGVRQDSGSGKWLTGILEHDDEVLIFANVGTPGRTGHDYDNQWEGPLLRWSHQRRSHLGWASVQRLLERDRVVHVFWRESNSDPFIYAGYATAIDVADKSPVEILWSFSVETPDVNTLAGPDELPPGGFTEGAARKVSVNVFERDRAAREACIRHYGPACLVCGLEFGKRYGETGAGFIHVHHLVPISDVGSDYAVDPIEDLRPICPNCHAMVHRRQPPLALDDVRSMLVD